MSAITLHDKVRLHLPGEVDDVLTGNGGGRPPDARLVHHLPVQNPASDVYSCTLTALPG